MNSPTPIRDNLRQLINFQLQLGQFCRRLPWGHRLLKGLSQAAQALIGASMGYGLGLLLHTQQAFWAALTAIAVTQQSYADTRASSLDQAIGALVGGVIGLVAAYLGHDSYIAYAIAIVVVIVSCWCLNVGSAGKLGATTATIVLLVPHTGPFWSVATTRLGEVTLGIACALAVTWLASHLEARWLGEDKTAKS